MNKPFCRSLIILLLNVGTISAKNGNNVPASGPLASKLCRSSFITVQLPEKSSEAVVAFLRENNESFRSPLSSLELKHEIESPGGIHFTFEQEYDNISVFNSQVKVNLNNAGEIKSVFDNSWFTESWNTVELQASSLSLNEKSAVEILKDVYSNNIEIMAHRKVIAILTDEPKLYVEIEVRDMDKGLHSLFLVDENLHIKLERNLTSNFSSSLETASALVYMPDPLTSAHVAYGGSYIDDTNKTNTALDNERKPVTISVTLSGNTYFLENNYVRIAEFSSPSISPVNSIIPFFEFNRSQSGFEDVNAFYHITAFNSYLQSLGFVNLCSFRIDVDTHGNNDDDQSNFYGGNPLRLVFGTGGVDDAEDADVIVHEYGHAISYRAAPNTNWGSDRPAIDEGLGDYFAAGYSKSIDMFNWTEVFSWDGHNPFWNGRTTGSSKTYPSGLGGNLHLDGEIWSSALIAILNQLGRETADQILIESLYGLTSGITMKDAAWLYIQADSTLNQGANFCVIYNTFLARGLVDPIQNSTCPPIGIATVKEDGNIMIYNSAGFMKGERLAIEMKKPVSEIKIELYTLDGKILLQQNTVNTPIFYLDGKLLPPGVYVLKVQTPHGQRTEKLVRIK